MKNLKFLFILILFTSCFRKKIELNIIPKPLETNIKSNTFQKNIGFSIIYTTDSCSSLANLLSQYLSENNLINSIDGLKNNSSPNFIKLEIRQTKNLNSEGYLLNINKSTIIITSSTLRGLFNGVQTLRQILYQFSSQETLPCLEIKDQPRFSWRGMHLDVSRHFMPKEYIKKYIDYIAFFKMNVFHWHLVDDQGWRIEIKRYPKLTKIGAWRDKTLIGHANNPPTFKYDGKRYGGFYTQEDIREIVKYASERYITILPEIEMPGHSQAAIAAYPYLGCTKDNINVWTSWGVSPYIYNVEDTTFNFLENVLDEVMELFPGKYIHVGGDETTKIQWQSSVNTQRKMKKLGLKNEQELQSYFIGRIEKYINSKGKIMIGWDEILEGGLAPNAVVMSWRGEEGGIQAVKMNHKVIMTPEMPCYFDHYQNQDTTEPLAFGGFTPLDSVYLYDPLPKAIPKEKAHLVLGSQGNVWTEYIPTTSQVDYMILPRMTALAEVLWTKKELKNYKDFKRRLITFEDYFIKNKINYAKHVFKK